MKYLVITNHSYMLWQFRKELIEALLRQGEVVISTPFVGHEQDYMALGCRCIETKMERRGMNLMQERKLMGFYRRLLKTEKPDLVITYSIKPNLYAGFLCSLMRIPYVVNVQGLGTAFQKQRMKTLAAMLYRVALKKTRKVFFENEANAKLFIDTKILPADKVILLPGAGVNLAWYTKAPYPTEEEGIHFLYLGRIMREKGMDELLPAVRRLKEEYGERVKFDFVGFFEDDYQEVIESLDRESILKFYGFQEDPRPYYAAAHCVVLPSWHEGMSNVLLEAASTGRPLICSDIPGCREAVEDGKTGFLCTVKDSDSLYHAMKRFLELPKEARAEMGDRGREKMELEFDRTMVVEEVLKAIQG